MLPAPDFFDDGVGIGGAGEGLWVVVGCGKVSVDGGMEINDALEDAALEPLPGQFGEEAFDGVEPGGRGWGEVEMEALVPFEPGADLGMLVRRVVVDDQVEFPPGRGLAVDLLEKADEFLMPSAAHALADDTTLQHIEGSEQRRRPVTLIVVRHRPP